MDQIDYKRELNRIFAEYATFFDLPIRTTEEKGDIYTRLPRSLFASLMMKEAHLLEQLTKGHLSLKELGEDCAALYAIADRDFTGMSEPKGCLDLAKIPKARWYLYLEGMNRIIEDVPVRASDLEFGQDPPFRERRKRRPPYLWMAGIGIAFLAGIILHKATFTAAPPAPIPTPVLVVDSPTSTSTFTETPTATETATSTPRPKPRPKPKPKAVQPRPTLTPTAVPTQVPLPEDAGLID